MEVNAGATHNKYTVFPERETEVGGQLHMETKSLRKSNVVMMTELALLTAIVILMAYTPLGYLKVGAVSITFIVVPVAVGAVLLGVKAGAFLGLVFGLTSLAQCFGMDAFGTMIFNAKPVATAVCCIVPRILVGVVPALVFMGMSKVCKKRPVNIAVSCVLVPGIYDHFLPGLYD